MTNTVHANGWTRGRQARSVAAVAVFVGLAICATPSLRAQTFSVLYQFGGGADGKNPQAELVRDVTGNLYGTTRLGGENGCNGGDGCGTVFKVDANGNETVLHRFTGASDGSFPFAGLVIDRDNNLYGTTFGGIGLNYGTVFRIDPSGKEAVLHGFGGAPFGFALSGGVVRDEDGNLYGTTQEGGASDSCWGGCGTVFKLDKAGNETVLFSFFPPAEYPTASLTIDAAGHLYGTTFGNGYDALGTAFKLTEDAAVPPWTLHTFVGGTGGELPSGSLVRDAGDRLYGMAYNGGDPNCIYGEGNGCGVVYELSPDGEETVLHSFAGPPDGGLPVAGLLRDNADNLYGTTASGGVLGYGAVFKLDKHGKLTILHSFQNKDGASPKSTLIQDAAGNLYGTTFYGGDFTCDPQYGCGVVFKITPK